MKLLRSLIALAIQMIGILFFNIGIGLVRLSNKIDSLPTVKVNTYVR